MKRVVQLLGSYLWWAYPRGSVQYDVMVGVILLFIFLTPRSAFRDQPPPYNPQPLSITVVHEPGGHLYKVVTAEPGADLASILARYAGHPVHIRKVENAGEQSTVVYHVWTD